MTSIALVPRNPISRGTYLGTKSLPKNYMSDFSLMGFVVDSFPEACSILSSAGFQLTERVCGADIAIDNPARVPEIHRLFPTILSVATFQISLTHSTRPDEMNTARRAVPTPWQVALPMGLIVSGFIGNL